MEDSSISTSPVQCTCPEGWTISHCPLFSEHLRASRANRLRQISKHWCVRLGNFTIEHRRGWHIYYIDLDRCNSSAAILDWIFQIRGKNWASAEARSTLLDLLDILLDPQRNFCSWGKDRPAKPQSDLRKLIHDNWHAFTKSCREVTQ